MAWWADGGATLTACYATGNVTIESSGTGSYFAGGVVGINTVSTLKACYAWGSVTGSGSGTLYVGGVTGSNDLGTLTACYHAKGTVSGPDRATGGVTGRNFKDFMFGGGIITACYWGDNGQTQGIGEDQVGTGGTTQVDGSDESHEHGIVRNGLAVCNRQRGCPAHVAETAIKNIYNHASLKTFRPTPLMGYGSTPRKGYVGTPLVGYGDTPL